MPDGRPLSEISMPARRLPSGDHPVGLKYLPLVWVPRSSVGDAPPLGVRGAVNTTRPELDTKATRSPFGETCTYTAPGASPATLRRLPPSIPTIHMAQLPSRFE